MKTSGRCLNTRSRGGGFDFFPSVTRHPLASYGPSRERLTWNISAARRSRFSSSILEEAAATRGDRLGPIRPDHHDLLDRSPRTPLEVDVPRRSWVKVHETWWTSPSHAFLSPFAKLLGPFLFWVADGDDWREHEDGEAALLSGAGKPLGAKELARMMGGADAVQVQEALDELETAGTLRRREDGAWCFPKFGRWQETPSAARKRKAKDRAPQREIRVVDEPVREKPKRHGAAAVVAERLQWGWDGQQPPRPKGCAPVKVWPRGIQDRLDEGYSAEELLDAVAGAAELVEDGELEPSKFSGTYIFSGHLNGLQQQIAEHRKAKAKKAEVYRIPQAAEEPSGPGLEHESVVAILSGAEFRRGGGV